MVTSILILEPKQEFEKMNKFVALIAVCVLSSFSAFAQNSERAEMECLYRLSFLKDTTHTLTTDDLMVLRFNKEKSLFYSLNSYTLDSLLCSDQGSAVQMDVLANGSSKYGKRIVSYNILKDFRNSQIDYTDNVGGEHYRYKEDLPNFNWVISTEQKKIWDYTCQKATCYFRGRTYEAWFTTEIPVNDGPWKFHGLPGLILEIYDIQKHYSFVFVGLRRSDANITMLPRQYTNSSREKYLKAYKNYIKDPVAFIAASSGMNITVKKTSTRKLGQNKTANYDAMERY